ncbi:hypothetical protein Goshw_004398 [Gossypium schwendimanii]|uniref:GAGA-binding transcriptional activator n=1 Tax=Gossypium schwendimanii TaxID=34291 RepID=A0A7J9MWS5_GOSSC|nr:hypothetical protein [Gossypium schwendimanii]
MRKQKRSMKGSNQIVSNLLRPKQPENKPSGPKKAKGPIVLEARRLVLAWHGRKMGNRACIKFVLRLTAEGHDLSQPVDLKDHCARHGTNNFVTIKLILYSMNYPHLARHHSP